jgi:hypothetical protein
MSTYKRTLKILSTTRDYVSVAWKLRHAEALARGTAASSLILAMARTVDESHSKRYQVADDCLLSDTMEDMYKAASMLLNYDLQGADGATLSRALCFVMLRAGMHEYA